MTPENIANYIGTYMVEAESMVFTDIADNLELNTFGCFINTCTSRKLCMELQEFLFPIQCGDEEPGEVLALGRRVADEYFRQEDEAVTMAEMSMP